MKSAIVSALVCAVFAAFGCGGSDSEMVVSPTPGATTETVLKGVPANPDPNDSYLIYLHGAIIETGGMRPTHPRFGRYEYASILQAFADRGFTVISEARPAGTRPDVFSKRVVQQVQQLVDAGVPERQITVVGFSKGSVIAILASAEAYNPGINWVFQAGCGPWVDEMPDLVPHGRVLSLYDRSDDLARSCRGLFDRMPEGAVVDEQVLTLDTAHGAFYTPNPSWVEPTIAWAGR